MRRGTSKGRSYYIKKKFSHVMHVPLNKVGQKAWLQFKKLDYGHPQMLEFNFELVNKAKRPINLDDPFVHVIGDFAVASFNKIIQMSMKKDVHNNLHDHEVMECNYVNRSGRAYLFYMTIEAIEEGILGVYETEVSCDPIDGCSTMTKFILTDHIPTGKIAMALPRLICLKSKYKTMKGMKRELGVRLEAALHKSMKGKNEAELIRLKELHKAMKGKNEAELIRLKELHKAMKGVCKVLYWNIRSKIPKTWNERSNTEDWSDWSVYPYDDLVMMRNDNATCKGYDFKNPTRLV